jgi:DNA polymerase-3 subunit alpha
MIEGEEERTKAKNRMKLCDDPAVFQMIAEGDTRGCFQIETKGITPLCKRLKVSSLEDIIHIVSLYRPAVLGTPMFTQYFNNRLGGKKISVHPALEKYLTKTYGVMIFQEQLMQMSMEIAGFTPSEADKLRKGMAKKLPEVIEEIRDMFMTGALRRGFSKREAKTLFNILEGAGYLFNKSHACAYSMISYWTAFLKHYYPKQFMCSLLNSEEKREDKLQEYFAESRRMLIRIKTLSVNDSDVDHILVNDAIVPGLKIVKNIGRSAAESIVNERHINGPYESVEDFLSRSNIEVINSRALASLISAGALDGLDYNRATLLQVNAEGEYVILELLSKIRKSRLLDRKSSAQESLFDTREFQKIDIELERIDEFSDLEIRNLEYDSLGFYLTDPMLLLENEIRENSITTVDEIADREGQRNIMAVGIVEDPSIFYTNRRNSRVEIARFTIRTLDDNIPAVMFGADVLEFGAELIRGNFIIASGDYNKYGDDVGLRVRVIKRANRENICL